MTEELSSRVDSYYTSDKSHFITIARWESIWGRTYEVGLRRMSDGKFVLAASHMESLEKTKDIGKAIKVLVDNGWDMQRISNIFPGLF